MLWPANGRASRFGWANKQGYVLSYPTMERKTAVGHAVSSVGRKISIANFLPFDNTQDNGRTNDEETTGQTLP